jgi:hypothetical protein
VCFGRILNVNPNHVRVVAALADYSGHEIHGGLTVRAAREGKHLHTPPCVGAGRLIEAVRIRLRRALIH